MAAPIYPGVWRAQAVFQLASALPEDRVVNTFHFVANQDSTVSGGTIEEIAAELGGRLGQFYEGNQTNGDSVSNYMSNAITSAKVRVYDLSTPDPREVATAAITGFTPSTSSGRLPNEVALCGTMYSERNLPRRRGRIYIGPFATNALATDSPSDARPAAGLVTAISQGLARLASEGVGDRVDLAVLSPTDGVARRVTHAWCDNAWDTVRSRGIKSSSRVLTVANG